MRILHLLDCSADAMTIACQAAVASTPGQHVHGVIALGNSAQTKQTIGVRVHRIAAPLGVPRLALSAALREAHSLFSADFPPDLVQIWGHRLRWLGQRLAGPRGRVCVIDERSGTVEARQEQRWTLIGTASPSVGMLGRPNASTPRIAQTPPIVGLLKSVSSSDEVGGFVAMLAMLATAGSPTRALISEQSPSLNRLRRHAASHPVAEISVTTAGFASRSLACDVLISRIARNPLERVGFTPSFADLYTAAWAASMGVRVLADSSFASLAALPGILLCDTTRPSAYARAILDWNDGRPLSAGSPEQTLEPAAGTSRALNDLIHLGWWRSQNGRT